MELKDLFAIFSKEDKEYAVKVYDSFQKSFDELSPFFEFLDDLFSDSEIDPIMGDKFTILLKAVTFNLVGEYISKYDDVNENGYEIDENGNSAVFYPEEAMKLLYQLTQKVVKQQETLNTYKYALDQLSKGNN